MPGKKTEVKPGLVAEEEMVGDQKRLTMHNQTRDKMFRCAYTFKGGSVRPLGTTTVQGEKHVLCVYPGESNPFVEGTWTSVSKSHGSGEPDKEWKEKQANKAKGEAEEDINQVKALMKTLGTSKVTVDAVADACSKAGTRFVDVSFPPRDCSVKPDWMKKDIKMFPWRRPSSYLAGTGLRPTLFVDKIEPNDIDQGALADCYFMGALASVAEFEHLVRSIFEQGQDPDLGIYRVTLCKNGWYQTVVVDDFLPCSGPKPAFARNREEPNELWVSLVEKAYAKLHGSYAAIMSGGAAPAMCDLTGCPYKTLELKEDMWDQLLYNDEHVFLQVLGTPGKNLMYVPEEQQSPQEKELWNKYQSVGLICEHSYSLITVKLTKGGHKLCMIRNPWGNEKEWTGKWSDHDKASWTPELKKECGFVAADDGSFWMEWKDVVKWFNTVAVCYTHAAWDQVRVAGNFEKGVADLCLMIDVKRACRMWFGVHQRDPRGVQPGHQDAKLDSLELYVVGSDSGGTKMKTLGRRSLNSRDLYQDIDLSPETTPRIYFFAQPKSSDLTKSMVYSLLVEDHTAVEISFRTPVMGSNHRYDSPSKFCPGDWIATEANYQIKGEHSTNGGVILQCGKAVQFKNAKSIVEKERAKAETEARSLRIGSLPPNSGSLPSQPVKVKVNLYKGVDMAAKDSNGLSDPFCELKLREVVNGKVGSSHRTPQKQVSKVIPKTLNPVWNQSFEFTVPPNDCVRISVFDKDIVGKDHMGRVDLIMPDIYPKLRAGTEVPFKMNVTPQTPDEHVSGYLEIGVTLL